LEVERGKDSKWGWGRGRGVVVESGGCVGEMSGRQKFHHYYHLSENEECRSMYVCMCVCVCVCMCLYLCEQPGNKAYWSILGT